MADKNLVICDHEFQYAKNLMENIAEHRELAIKAYACTTWENVKAFSKEKKIDILIASETCPEKERKEINAEQVFVLTTGGSEKLQSDETGIYKYQCADEILTEIFETYFEKTKEGVLKSVRKEQLKIFGIYSPIHRSGRTTFALELGKELAKKTSVLYLNLEEYAGFGERFQREEGKNLGDILYYTKQEEGNFGFRLSSIVKSIGELDYIPPIPLCSDLKEVTWEEWEELIVQIANNSIYEILILDLSESVQGMFHMLQLCDYIYMPILEDRISKEKLNQYEKNIEKLGFAEIASKTYPVLVTEHAEECVKRLIKEERVCFNQKNYMKKS